MNGRNVEYEVEGRTVGALAGQHRLDRVHSHAQLISGDLQAGLWSRNNFREAGAVNSRAVDPHSIRPIRNQVFFSMQLRMKLFFSMGIRIKQLFKCGSGSSLTKLVKKIPLRKLKTKFSSFLKIKIKITTNFLALFLFFPLTFSSKFSL